MLQRCVKCTYTVKNAIEVKTAVEPLKVPPTGCLVSFDVEKLYPKINQDLIIDNLRKVLSLPENSSLLSPFTVNQIIEVVRVIFQTTYVVFQGKAYFQSGGVPAGSPLSSFLCDVVLNELDIRINDTFKGSILLWNRFLDDIFAALSNKVVVTQVQNELNKFHDSLLFTSELECIHPPGPPSLAFLDIKIQRYPSHCISAIT